MLKEYQQTETRLEFQAFFERTPGSFLILQPNPPFFTIVDASNDLLRLCGRDKSEIVGRNLFDAFPENPDDITSSGPSNLLNSLRKALDSKKPHTLPVLRYDVQAANGRFEERYWKSSNTPILNKMGKVRYIIHSTEEVTEQVLSERQ